ncbi:SDR family oxidoreductase [Novosphingobium sp. BL-8A]|uniref:SDR family oxidoreductase n=1 Tax=Novosphingobium sp. BL-8A TaxID=3127639 RepID=UPI003757D5AD
MKIAVIGGTGLIGEKLTGRLIAAGHDVAVIARSRGVDVSTGIGLEDALAGANVVFDVSNPGYEDAAAMEAFFAAAGSRLMPLEREIGVGHHILLSAVGADALEGGYFRAKRTQERAVQDGGVPFTILRATPFFEFIYNIVDAGGQGDAVRLPPVHMQPVAADDVANALSRMVFAPATDHVVEIAGPDRRTLPDLAAMILTANEDGRRIVVDQDAPYFGAHFESEPLTGGDHPRFAPTSFEDWLRHWIAMA